MDQALYTETIHKFLTMYRHLRRYGRQMQQDRISGRKIAALRHLLQSGPLTIGQLRDYLYVSDSSTSELIARLQKKGLVTRARSDKDNRVVIVTLTEAGRAFAEQTTPGGVSLLREKLKTLPRERLALINQATTEIMDLLEIKHDH
jgi:DNA-binding MarR family transcriptional regulator